MKSPETSAPIEETEAPETQLEEASEEELAHVTGGIPMTDQGGT